MKPKMLFAALARAAALQGAQYICAPSMLRVERIVQLSTDIGESGVRVRALIIEGLLRAKNALRRPKDVQDVAELCAIREARELLAHDANSLRLHESP